MLINYDDAEKGKIHLNYSCINIFQSERGIYRIHMHIHIYGTWVSCVLGNDFIVYINIYVCVCIYRERERRKRFHKSSDNVRKLYTFILGNRIMLYAFKKNTGLTRHAQTAFETEVITPAAVTQTK